MADYRYLLVDASAGTNIGELPLAVSSFSRLLNGVGQLDATLPLDHPLADDLAGDREITVLRDDAPVWNGPLVMPEPTIDGRDIQVTAREAHWYLSKRTLEIDKNFRADLYYIVRAVVAYAIDKQSNGRSSGGSSINATIPRFYVSPTGPSGTTKAVRYYGAARHLISDIIDDLVADPTTGLDYRMDYATGSTRLTCSRTLTLGSPSLGSQRTHRLTEHVLHDFSVQFDRQRAASRVHVVGSGYTATAQNTGSVAAGDILIESVFDRSDKANRTFLDNYARQARYASQPPVTVHSLSYVPSDALPFRFADLGDTANVQIGGPGLLATTGYRRVLQETVVPNNDQGLEVVTLTTSVPLDSLGT